MGRTIPIGVATALSVLALSLPIGADGLGRAVRITSPLGRTGLPGQIRIVARIDGQVSGGPLPVSFYVDGNLLATDTDGPPYDALWSDDNPFEQRELMVEVALPSGEMLHDTTVLKPLEVTEAADVASVAFEATVTDEKGRFVKDLTAADFTVLEDDQPQTLDVVSQTREPGLFALLVDGSQSMAIRSNTVRAVATRLIEPLGKDDEIVVAPFSNSITTVTGPTTDRETVLEAIEAIHHAGGTAIYDSVREAAGQLAVATRRKAIVLITDGYDENSRAKFDPTIETLRRSGVTLYVIGLGGVAGISLDGEKLLRDLAEATGGHAWFPRDERQLVSAYEAIAGDVQNRYFLTYTPQNQSRDGKWRAIDVRVPDAHFRINARKGYTAPIAPPVRVSLEFTGVGAGQTPLSLTRDDLTVVEDGVRQNVDVFQDAVQPVTFMLALDASGSMKKSAAQAQDAAREFVTAMRPEDELGMILFNSKSNYIHSPMVDRDVSLKAIDTYVAGGGTALYDAMYDCLAQLATVKTRRVVVVVTDGRDENAASNGPGSVRKWDEVLAKLEQTDATIYAVGLGKNVDRRRLQLVADRSGGAAYFPTDVTTLAADYHKILDELRRRYIVGYESTNRLRDGHWRKVDIKTHDPGVEIRSRGGYYAPPQ